MRRWASTSRRCCFSQAVDVGDDADDSWRVNGVPRLRDTNRRPCSYAFHKAKAHLRMTGPALNPKSLLTSEGNRGAAKADPRASCLVADPRGNKLLFIREPVATAMRDGCRRSVESTAAAELYRRRAIRSRSTSRPRRSRPSGRTSIFTEAGELIYDFYRVKATRRAAPDCTTQIVGWRKPRTRSSRRLRNSSGGPHLVTFAA
jgi:hypothetical protein